ncbi:hypothetical protein Taro_029982 [Colocasia esculenta]|uniref:HMA domain-containing protein n=1 Tax=Colocasia esculenta TaxID=4460 RepID=A0A843VF59_COLES|nr:hypothetical protein [Colocasia esculenta]
MSDQKEPSSYIEAAEIQSRDFPRLRTHKSCASLSGRVFAKRGTVCSAENMSATKRIVIKIPMTDKEMRMEAMKIAIETGKGNIKSITIDGTDKLVVVGEGIDACELTKELREGMGFPSTCSMKWLFNRRNSVSVDLLTVTDQAKQPQKGPQGDSKGPSATGFNLHDYGHLPATYPLPYAIYDPPYYNTPRMFQYKSE